MSVIVKYEWISILWCVISYNVGGISVEQKIDMELRMKEGERLWKSDVYYLLCTGGNSYVANRSKKFSQ